MSFASLLVNSSLWILGNSDALGRALRIAFDYAMGLCLLYDPLSPTGGGLLL